MLRRVRIALLLLVLTVVAASVEVSAQITTMQRAQARQMLRTIREALKSEYYDPAFRGIDLAEYFKAAEKKLDTVETIGRAYAVIAQALVDLGDSHTYFIPPDVPASYDYGWRVAMIGDLCLVVGVKPGSDAEIKGLRVGDRIRAIESVPPSRVDLWKMRYALNVLYPRRQVRLTVESAGHPPRVLEVETKVTPRPKELRINFESLIQGIPTEYDDLAVARLNRFERIGPVAVWRLEDFDVPPDDINRQFDQAVKGASDLIIDLRGNPGGYVKTLEELAGRFFERDVKIADLKTRKSSKASMAKAGKNPFKGRIVALVDSESASAAEILARILQLEGRAVIIGDRTAGAVMVGRRLTSGIRLVSANEELTILPFGFSVTVADLIMRDGKSLEGVGVIPDELLLPSQTDLASGLDPVLARAATMLGVEIGPAAAGKLFPIVWR